MSAQPSSFARVSEAKNGPSQCGFMAVNFEQRSRLYLGSTAGPIRTESDASPRPAMPALSFLPGLSLLALAGRVPPIRPLKTLLRTAGHRLRPPCPKPFTPSVHEAEQALLWWGQADPTQRSLILSEERRGLTPTIVLGGFVPDATEQVYLLRGFLLRQGSVFCIHYARTGFSFELLCAQLDDLVTELATKRGTPPVIFAVSFGAGFVLEWLKRNRRAGRTTALGGLVLISPVACIEDVLAPGGGKSATLLGRAVQPYLTGNERITPAAVEKSRVIFTRMFEAGAQNRSAVAGLLSREELGRLRSAVLGTIRGITDNGARERMQALRSFEAPSAYFSPEFLPLSEAPALVLFAENEDAVITPHSPTRFALENGHRAYFPRSISQIVRNRRGTPVQHASLVFHCFNFLPLISRFYRRLKSGKLAGGP